MKPCLPIRLGAHSDCQRQRHYDRRRWQRDRSLSRLRGRSVQMHGHLKTRPGVFDPDEVRILSAALDKAWQSIQAGGAKFDTDAEAEAVRAILAKHIIETAKKGERDERQLCDGALAQLVASNLGTAPRRDRA